MDRFWLWYDVVEAYSALQYTNPEMDRIVALSGLASEFQKAIAASNAQQANRKVFSKTSDPTLRYTAGLWMEHAYVG